MQPEAQGQDAAAEESLVRLFSDSWTAVDWTTLLYFWRNVLPLFRQAVSVHDGSYDEDDMAAFVLRGQWRLWVYPDAEEPTAICLTEIVDYPRKRVLHIRAIAGEWQTFADNLHLVEHEAKVTGCNSIRAFMRKGLTKRLPPEWKASRQVCMEREL